MYLFRAEPPRINLHKPSNPRAFPLPLSHPTPKPPQLASLGHRLFAADFFSPSLPQPTSSPGLFRNSLPSSSPTLARKLLNPFHLPVHHRSLLRRYTVTSSLPISLTYTNFTVAMNTNATVSKHQDIVPSGADDSWRSKQFYSEKATPRKETKILTYPSTVHC